MDQVNLAVIGFDGVQLLIPQTGVATIEMLDTVQAAGDTQPGAVGKLQVGEREWPVYALDAQFKLLNQTTAGNKYCVAFDLAGQPAFALTCDTVSSVMLESHVDQINPLQPCMQNARNPLEAMLLKNGELMLLSGVEPMLNFLALDNAA